MKVLKVCFLKENEETLRRKLHSPRAISITLIQSYKLDDIIQFSALFLPVSFIPSSDIKL
jgi:hypothetical protein